MILKFALPFAHLFDLILRDPPRRHAATFRVAEIEVAILSKYHRTRVTRWS